MKRFFSIALAAAMLVALLCGCNGKSKRTWVNCGKNEEIPCVGIPNGEFAVAESFRYSFRKAQVSGIDSEWGTLTKVAADENAPIVNRPCGEDMYLTRHVNTTVETYQSLLKDMKKAGFKVYAQSNLGEDVHSTTLTYQDNAYTATYFAGEGRIDVVAASQMKLSPYLQPKNESTQAQQLDGLELELRMIKPVSTGSGFVIQLKNGNFVIMDGGNQFDLNQYLTFMEENTPEGQIPVVEAWFITHADYDHTAWTSGFTGTAVSLKHTMELVEPIPAKDRIRVNGVYYNAPDASVLDAIIYTQKDTVDGVTYYEKTTNGWVVKVDAAVAVLKDQKNEPTPIYRPMTGQTFHFSGGLTVETMWSQEQMNISQYEFDFKTASASYVVRAEGNTVLAMGSANKICQSRIAETYSASYLEDVDVLLPAHYGRRLYEEYKDVFKAPAILFEAKNLTGFSGESKAVAEHYLSQPDIKCYSYADGSLVYNFAAGEVTVQ